MADKKISALNAATTPLAGSEVLPIVQSGSTLKVSVDNLTAGKSVVGLQFIANGTGANALPVGTTAQRPTPAQGMIRMNSTTGYAEYYDGLKWVPIATASVVAV